jgi:ankyrin repeat protein
MVRESVGMPQQCDLERFITERLGSGTFTHDDLLRICAVPKLKKQYFNQLLAAGVNMRVTDSRGRNALFSAAESGNLVLLRALLEQGLDPMARDDHGELPVAAALRCGNPVVAECLLERTADPASVVDDEGSTLLHKAAWGDVAGVARRLLDGYGIPREVRDRAGRTAVHVAAYQGSCKMLKYLLGERSADVNAVDREGRTPLFSAAYDGNLRALKLLCEYGADRSVKDRNGLTALDFATGRREFKAAKVLSDQRGGVSRA